MSESDLAVKKLVSTWRCPAKMQVRLELLIGLHEYFKSNPTRLCRIMKYNGSDKALGWHSYAYIYNYLLPLVREEGETLLEIGIGTNFLDTVSNMGVTGVPGASLRGWREFTGAGVHGADVDRRILFQEPGISTYFVDQTDRATIDELWRTASTDAPTIVIDDGLHTFDANVNVLESSRAGVPTMRLFVVEDILRRFLRSWNTYLETADFGCALVDIPHIKNDRDNILLFVFYGAVEWRDRLAAASP